LLDDLGLIPALRALVTSFTEQTGLSITFDAPTEAPPLTEDAQLALFRALQEALSNVARHSGATAAHVTIVVANDQLTMRVQDNGQGIPTTHQPLPSTSVGLSSMRERISALHGTVNLESEHPGASLTIKVPLDDAR
jgi:signal transduction histidine kinase